jgi:hypothetical protein
MGKMMKNLNCVDFVLLISFIVISMMTTSAIYAAQHNGTCVTAKVVVVASGGCSQVTRNCVGTVTYTYNAVHGYCDTAETGECWDSTVVLIVPYQQTVTCGYYNLGLGVVDCLAPQPVNPPSMAVPTPSCI